MNSVQWNGETQLPEPVREELAASLHEIRSGGDSDWVGAVEEQIRGKWQENGYFKADVKVRVVPLNSDPERPVVSLAVEVKEGPQYRLGELQFASQDSERSLLFSHAVLRPLFPIHDDDILDVSKLRAGIEALKRLYGAQGYVDAVIEPSFRFDEARGRISLTLTVLEGKQFVIEAIQFVGLLPQRVRRLSLRLQPGRPLDSTMLEAFFEENKHLLPAEAGPRNVAVRRNLRLGTAALTFDFRPCVASQHTPPR